MHNLHETLFRCRDGSIVYGQRPNVPLLVGIIGAVVAIIPLVPSEIKVIAGGLSIVFLFTWAYLEFTYGVNLFRRLLGASGLLAIIAYTVLVIPLIVTVTPY